MNRDIEKELLHWKQSQDRLPLLLRGARQVGKTFIIEKFASQHFSSFLSINLELKPSYCSCFESLDPQKITAELELLSGTKIIPGETLLFIDEIQDCPKAIMAFRYFKEQMQTLHVIGAGSLLEFTLNDPTFRMPVGRVDFLYLQPLSFMEFLEAIGSGHMREQFKRMSLSNPPSVAIHEHLLTLVRDYTILGGMPAVIKKYLLTKSFLEAQHRQSALLNSYRRDFGKYDVKGIHLNLRLLFDKAPGLVGQWFKYKNVSTDIPSKDIKLAYTLLCHAGILHPIYATAASGIPLSMTQNERKFKLLFLDVGLVKRACGLDAELLLKDDIFLLNKGALAEQFVGQELLAYQEKQELPELYFWAREEKNSSAEVDYLTVIDTQIIPIEVKSGSTGTLKSLRIFMEEKKNKIGIRISKVPLSLNQGVLSVPFYLISEVPRLVREAAKIT